MVINGAHKHIPTPSFIILPLAGCYRTSKWQMPESSPAEKHHHHPGSGTGEFKRSRMRLRLSSYPPQWLWHLARATFHTESSTTKPVSTGAIIYSKSTQPWSWWLALQSSMVPCCSCSVEATRKDSHSTEIQCRPYYLQTSMYVLMQPSWKC